jgi:hypothetical protein
MMSEMVERVARAAYEKFNENQLGDLEPTWDNLEASLKDRMIDALRAAIGAMRTPTEEMLSVGSDTETASGCEIGYGAVGAAWQAMIDEALK